jgi:uncharacterized protein YcbX
MHLEELWRYPVKSMGGERLERAALLPDGVEGDRVLHVEDGQGRVVTARTRPKLLGLQALRGPGGEPLVDGRPWRSEEVAADVVRAAGPGARLVSYDGLERFDVLPLLVVTDGAITAFGHDRRRLRPNLLIGGVEGLAERTWEGRRLRVGDCLIQIADLRARCVMTTFDPDSLAQDVRVLKKIVRELDGTLGLNCSVLEPGELRVGDKVELLG